MKRPFGGYLNIASSFYDLNPKISEKTTNKKEVTFDYDNRTSGTFREPVFKLGYQLNKVYFIGLEYLELQAQETNIYTQMFVALNKGIVLYVEIDGNSVNNNVSCGGNNTVKRATFIINWTSVERRTFSNVKYWIWRYYPTSNLGYTYARSSLNVVFTSVNTVSFRFTFKGLNSANHPDPLRRWEDLDNKFVGSNFVSQTIKMKFFS